ncbi:cyclic nucleotide-binding domain-containing protein 2-like [Plakobranchus ocellatus]|uniref:Cyclic nucleotide-binding domain-containing protein 2-like n=1 Tax=Plakobranchus ocellatus TaxID=259542 RepID=A0AAV3XX37_9GAST|nr:cyclic nucleotide-binding domain-containing protein 2-like [Plakobranchus ocellatus]
MLEIDYKKLINGLILTNRMDKYYSKINTGRRSPRRKVSTFGIINEVKAHNNPVSGTASTKHTLQSCPEEEEDGDQKQDKGSNQVPTLRNSGSGSRNAVNTNSRASQELPRSSFSKLTIGPPHFRSTKRLDCDSKENGKAQHFGSYTHRRYQRRQQQQLQQQQQQKQPHEVPPVFVQIELLKPRDVFGLDLVNFNSLDFQRSTVSLVSLGAECIMLSKAFFLKHANDRVKKRFSEIVHPYPDERSLQASLQNKADWELYKHSLLATITAPKPTGLRDTPLTSHF